MRSLACRKRFDDFTLSDDRSGTPAPGGDFHCTARTVPYRLRARRAVLRAGFPCCRRAKKHAQALLRRDFAATAQSVAVPLFTENRPACHVQLRPDVSVAVFYAPGFPLAVKEQKRMPSASAPGLCPALQSAAALLLQKATPECHVQLRPDVSVAVFYAPGLPLAIRERKIIPKRLCARTSSQRYNPPQHVSPENRPGMPCAVMTRCIR